MVKEEFILQEKNVKTRNAEVCEELVNSVALPCLLLNAAITNPSSPRLRDSHMRRHFLVTLLAALLGSSFGCGPSDTVTVQGCGATFPAPLYKRWFLEYYRKHPNVRVNYQAIGSGAGIQQLEEGLVLFGATDEALEPERLKEIAKKLSERDKYSVELMQIPLTGGSVAICYNVPGDPQLKLSRKTYVDMLLGEIKFWDDPRIQSTNPDVQLPHQEMTFVRRAESSGTTFVFTNHLNAIDPRWTIANGGPGVGKTVHWSVGIGGKGTSGVNALIQQIPGAFGYIEEGYAKLTNLSMAALENKSGNFVLPDAANAREALQEAKFNQVLGATIPDPTGPNAYPIVSFTWVVCRKSYPDAKHAAKLKDVLNYCLESEANGGQVLSEKLGYVRLPADALLKARKAVSDIKTD
jgi:phosphate transport system substrate-binding protein